MNRLLHSRGADGGPIVENGTSPLQLAEGVNGGESEEYADMPSRDKYGGGGPALEASDNLRRSETPAHGSPAGLVKATHRPRRFHSSLSRKHRPRRFRASLTRVVREHPFDFRRNLSLLRRPTPWNSTSVTRVLQTRLRTNCSNCVRCASPMCQKEAENSPRLVQLQ